MPLVYPDSAASAPDNRPPAGGGRLVFADGGNPGAPPAPPVGAKDEDPRGAWTLTKDLAASGLQGLVGISKLPAMGLDKAITGKWIGPGVEALGEFEESVADQKSDYLRGKERASQERTAAAGKRAREAVGGGEGVLPTTAQILAEFGVGAWEAVKDPTLLSAQLAQQAPMLGASRIGGLATDAAVRTAAQAAPRLAGTALGKAVLAGAATAGAVGTGAGLQGADIGSDAYRRLMALPDEQWLQVPGFADLAKEVGTEEAKATLASDKAFVAALQAGAASLLSTALPGGASIERALVGKGLGGAPLAAVGKAIAGESMQEGVEEGYGALAANDAVRQVNPQQSLAEGVGSAAGQGAALGGLIGGGTQAWAQRGELAQAAKNWGQAAPEAAAQPPADLSQAELDREQPAEPAMSDADAALRRPPVELTALDRVQQLDGLLATAQGDEAAALQAERAELTKGWPSILPGARAEFSTETGARLEGQYALIEADDLQPSHTNDLQPNPAFPQALQPRQRDRASSATQIQSIVGRLDPARLGESATAGDGAPIIGADGLVESGNARTIALRRVYAANGLKAEQYRSWLADNAERFGLQPDQVAGMRRPVLVRVRSTPVNRAEFARQANAPSVATMSPREQALADAARIDSLEDLQPTEQGEFASSRSFIRRFVGALPETERGAMLDADGRLSSSGYARARNAVLAKAYGDSPVLTRLVESMDEGGRNIARALVMAAPRMAQARSMMEAGRRHGADITGPLVEAVAELERLRQAGQSVDEALQQQAIDGQARSPEAGKLLQFLAENQRRPRRVADLLTAYADALDAAGDPAQGDLLGGAEPPTVGALLDGAIAATNRGFVEAPPPAAPAEIPAAPAANDPRAEALQGFKDAMADLGDALTRGQRAAVVEENGPGIKEALVRAFEQGIKLLGTDLQRVISWVKQQLKANPATKPHWNKITAQEYRDAALEALERVQRQQQDQGAQLGLFDSPEAATDALQNDLFASAPAQRRNPNAPGETVDSDWRDFPASMNSLGIPRADMPQLEPGALGALADYLASNGVMSRVETVPATSLKPSQMEYSEAKVERAGRFQGEGGTVLVSSDGYVMDGHHRWMAQARAGQDVRVMRVNLPATAALTMISDFARGKRKPGEADKAYAKRVVDRGPVPKTLPENHAAYFEMKGAKVVPIEQLRSTKSDAENQQGGENGPKRMAAAARGELGKRAPITVMPAADGQGYDVVDGNGTLTSVKRYGWQSLPVQVVSREQGLRMIEADKAADQLKELKAATKIDGRPYVYASTEKGGDNTALPEVEAVVAPDVLADARALIARLHAAPAPVQISDYDRRLAESMLRPALERAKADKQLFEQHVLDVVKETGALGQWLAPLKKLGRAAEKLVAEEHFDLAGMKDLLRATIIVRSYSEAMAVRTALAARFKILRTKDKTRPEAREAQAGYADVTVNVITPNGSIAEVQINVPEMMAAKEGPRDNGPGHKLYEIARAAPRGTERNLLAVAMMHRIYDPIYERSASAEARSTPSVTLPPDLSSRSTRAALSSAASEVGAPRGGSEGTESSVSPSSLSRNTLPSGNSTKSSPEKLPQNEQPGGNLSGSFTGQTSNNAPQDSTLATQGERDAPVQPVRPGAEGPGAEVPSRARGERGTDPVSQRPGPGGQGRDLGNGAGQADAGTAVPGEGAGDERGSGQRARNRHRRGAAEPAGRDIAPKSGLNYRFTDEDISPPGSWAKRAEWNVEAVELVKKLEAEKRRATPDEQRALARFVGWGASDIAQNLFSPKLDKARDALEAYERAVEAFEKRENRPMRVDPYAGRYGGAPTGFYDAFRVLQFANPDLGYYQTKEITREQLDKAAPPKTTRRWLALRDRLKAVLTEAEWNEASRTTQYGHFTAAPIVRGMWTALRRFGFEGGLALEPGAGKGNFPGLMPDALAANTSYTGIEYDSITGAILQQLFPDERMLVESFIDSKLPRDFYDVAIGNPPFGDLPILADKEYRDKAFKIHDYFFAKTIDRVRPGGLLVFVTSRGTMDKKGDAARKYLGERADLVGAIRLPQAAFKDNAGTDVVTDVLFLRKKLAGQDFEHAQPWTNTVDIKLDGETVPVNEYFVAHPEMILGRQAMAGTMYSKNEYTVLPDESDIGGRFLEAVGRMPEGIFTPPVDSAAHDARVRNIDFNPKAKKDGNYYLSEAGELMQREGGQGMPVTAGMTKAERAIVADFIPLRDALKQAQHDQLNGGDWETSLAGLRQAYDAFVAKHGNLLQSHVQRRKVKVDVLDDEGNPTGEKALDEEDVRIFPMRALLAEDPDSTLVLALENVDEETGKVTPAESLSKRVLGAKPAAAIATVHDAMLATLADTGRVDIAAIGERMDMTDQEVIEALGAAVYRNPEGGAWETADAYLSGNVKDKLTKAVEAARQDKRYERNIEALKAAQPAAKGPNEINVGLGMNWIPHEYYEQFLRELVNVRASVRFNDATKQWSVSVADDKYAKGRAKSLEATADWGTTHRPAHEILLHALTGRPIRITQTVKTDKGEATVVLTKEMEAANEKLNRMRQEFQAWVWRDAERSNRLVTIYNDTFNTTVPRKFDGSFLTLPGSSNLIQVYDHVKRGAWRIVQTGNTYLAHAVGSGKTWASVISIMEQRRLGLVSKPMVVVPNHMLQQFAAEWLQLYPAARLMVADEANFTGEKRRRFVSRVALSDLDGVIITHDAFKRLDLDPDFKAKIVQEELALLRASLAEAESEDGTGKKGRKSPRVKQIEKQIERLEQRLTAKADSGKKDQNVRFDELGVDMLYVDEAHVARKLDIATSRQVKGISTEGSQLAMNLYMAVRYLEEKRPGRSLVMMSGTPVTNTLGELYTVNRFMNLQGMKARGLDDFDSWASMFGRENTALEVNAAGKYEPVTRFTKFVNVPELTQMFREFADVLTSDQLAKMLGDKRPKVEGGARRIVVTPKTKEYVSYQRILEDRYAKSRDWKPSKDQPNNPDPLIAIIGDGRLAAIDMRFIYPDLPSDPDSKLNRLIDDVIAEYKETEGLEYADKKTGKIEPNKGSTMMVFSDLGFGQGVAQHRGFSGRAWFEKRLRDAGIPPSRVAFMEDHKKSHEKVKLFRAMNTGAVRILVGSSKNMGTGVNAQQRLRTLFHLDVPWFPADLEQREGRAVRQGNKNKTVRLVAYAAKGSYDQQMWQLVAGKQAFIDAALSGDETIRELDDLSAVGQAEMAAGMVADDPRVIQLAGLRADVDRLNRLYQAHESQRARFMQDFDWSKREADALRLALPKAEKVAAGIPDVSGDNFKATVQGKVHTVRKEWVQALRLAANDLAAAAMPSSDLGTIGGLPVRFSSIKSDGGRYEWHVRMERPDGRFGDVLFTGAASDDMGVAMRATNVVADVRRAPAAMRDRISQLEANMDALRPRLQTRFPMLDLLASKQREVADLEYEIAFGEDVDPDTALALAATGMVSPEMLMRESEPTYGGRTLAEDLEAQEKWLQAEAKARGFADIDALLAAKPEVFEKLAEKWRKLHPVEDNAVLMETRGGRRASTGVQGDLFNHQLDLFLSSRPDESQAGEGIAGARRAAADALGLLRGTGTLLGRALSSGLAARQRVSLVGQVARTDVELATLAQVYRDPRFETFRLFFVDKDDRVVSQIGLTSRLPGSTTAIVGDDVGLYARRVASIAKEQGAVGVWLLHNHPSGDPTPSTADRMMTGKFSKSFDRVGLEVFGHVVIDTNKYGVLDPSGMMFDVVPLETKAEEPFAGGGFGAGMTIGSPADLMNFAKALTVDRGAVTVIALSQQNKVHSITRLPASIFEGSQKRIVNVLRRATLAGNGARLAVVGRDRTMMGRLNDMGAVIDAIYVDDEGRTYSMAERHGRTSEQLLPRDRGVRVTGDTSPAFDFLRAEALAERTPEKTRALKAAEEDAIWSMQDTRARRRAALEVLGQGWTAKAGVEGSRDAFERSEGGIKATVMRQRTVDGNYYVGWAKNGRAWGMDSTAKTLAEAAAMANRKFGLKVAEEGAQYETEVAEVKARAEALILTSAATPRPVDNAFKLAARVSGLERFASVAYGLGARLIERFTPESVKAGIVSDYGIPEAVIDRRGELQGSMRGQLLDASDLVGHLATLTRAESRVVYEWMNAESDQAGDELVANLPPESKRTLKEVRQLIEKLSDQAVELGQLDPEARERHRNAYLRRSYFKHAADLTANEKHARGRAVSILGEQYKGRGLVRTAPMRQVQNIAPEWWGRKLKEGKADTSLKGEKFIRFERRAPAGAGVENLAGVDSERRPTKLLEVQFWPADEALPARYADWERAGTWEVVDTKGGDLVLWRDFTKAEREKMGEIDEARYAIARTLRGMIHDIEVGRYLRWLAQTQAKKPGEELDGEIVDASELGWGSGMKPLPPGTWVKVPDTKIPGTSVHRYGDLAGRYLPGPIWNDVRQLGTRYMPFGESYQAILRAWKISKTALSPAVHMNNIMSNFVMADWHDVTAGHVAKSLQIILAAHAGRGQGAIGAVGNLAGKKLGLADIEAAQEVLRRYEASGGSIGGWVAQEISNETMDHVRDLLRAEVNAAAAATGRGQVGVFAALQLMLRFKLPAAWDALSGSKAAARVITEGSTLIDLYQAEDDVFRLAAWLRAKENGASDGDAGRVARKSFLDYSINAPWVAAMRATAWPFISYTYRAIPMLLEVMGKRPHKLVKLMAFAGALNAIGTMLAGADSDDEERSRRMLPDEKAGKVWGIVPKLIRMPWNDAHGSPVYLDIRRWIPVGDVLDLGQGNAVVPVPPALLPGGPLAIFGEIVFNKSMFTGKEISNRDTDTTFEQATKAADHLWKAAMPNILGLPNTYATEGVVGSLTGRTDAFGREMSPAQAVSSAFGVKLGSYPDDVLERNLAARALGVQSQLDQQVAQVKRQYATGRITEAERDKQLEVLAEKKRKVADQLREKVN